MRMFSVLVALIFSGSAFAEDVVYAVGEVSSVRFADADVKGPTFAANAQLDVLLRDGARVRVRAGDDYGWVAASSVTATAPAAPAMSVDPMSDPAVQELLRSLQLSAPK